MTVIQPQPSGVQWLVSLLQLNWDMLVTFSLPEINLNKQMRSSWAFHEVFGLFIFLSILLQKYEHLFDGT
jgi:hypothetical protein